MAKLLTIKINKDGGVDIHEHLPDGMTQKEVRDHLTVALPMATAHLALTRSLGTGLTARVTLRLMYKLTDQMLSREIEKEVSTDEHCACRCEADDLPDD